MWEEIGLIGRDKLLKKELYPRTNKRRPFFLTGHHGTGKTALIRWSYNTIQGRKSYISSTWTIREILIQIVKDWELEIEDEGKKISPNKASVSRLEETIAKQRAGIIYIDHVNKATPAQIRRIKIWKERFTLYLAGTPPYREELRPILWGIKEIPIGPIDKQYRNELALAMCRLYEATTSHEEIARASRGYPGRMAAMVISNEVEDTSHRVEGEELDLSPLLLVVVVAIVAVRYIGVGLNELDLYVMGGMGMGVAMLLRFFLFKGMKKK